MNIVYVVPNIRSCGPINVVVGIMKRLSLRHTVTIVSVFGDRDDKQLIKTLKHNNIDACSLGLSKVSFLMKGSKKLYRALEGIKPEIVHSHGLQADILVAKTKGNYKRISTIHSNIMEDYYLQFGKIFSIPLIRYRLKLLKKFDRNVCCSESVKEALQAKTKTKLSYIRNGVAIVDKKVLRNNSVRRSLHIPDKARVFLFAGPLNNRKRVPDLIDLFQQNAKEEDYLLIAGDGPCMSDCKKIKSNNNVFLLGMVDDVAPYYKASDVYISNSMSEGLPMSVLGAMSFDKLLLLSDIPAHQECLNIDPDNKCGLVFNQESFRSAFKRVKQLLDMNKGGFKNKEKLSVERMGDEYEKLYKEVCYE